MPNKLNIAFVYSKRYSFYPPDYFGRGLGGTECMLVLLARALARLGHNVEVYNCCFKDGIYDGVKWKSLWTIDQNKKFDVVISLRLLETFKNYTFNSTIRAVWIHDEELQGATELDKNGLVNMWISVSSTQKEFIERKEVIQPKNWFVTRNAFDEEIYTNTLRKIKKIKNQVIYCSSPDRGLRYLLDIWPEIKERIPDAKLIVTGSYALWGTSDEENNRIFREIYNKASNLKDVKVFQRLSKRELAKLQAESEIMLYPTAFNEMFCISALECFVVGTPIISSKRAAMIERVQDEENGFLIDSLYGSSDYKKEFIDKSCYFFENQNVKDDFSKNASSISDQMNFEKLAKEWESEFLKRLK
ncbi:MAG: glycosyltransferase family 4 protein [bacterium]